MKAFVSSLVAVVLIAVVAAVALESLGWSSAQIYSTSDVRL
jgi:type II secretory pathway pseudopilin PulG